MWVIINIFLTGKKRVGKSTILEDILKELKYSFGGYVTERKVENDKRIFTIKSLYDGNSRFNIAKVNINNYEKKVFIEVFEKNLINILDNSMKYRDIIVLDELGSVENDINIFTSKVYELLDSKKPVVGVIKEYDCEFLNNIRNRKDVKLIEVTENNRDMIKDEILKLLDVYNK